MNYQQQQKTPNSVKCVKKRAKNMWGSVIALSWFDVWTVALPFLTVLLLQFINVALNNTTTNQTTSEATTEAPTKSTKVETNGKLEKQRSEQSENAPPSLPASSARHSLDSLTNGSTPSTPILRSSAAPTQLPRPDSFSDEFHEDEDTLSLDNLFPCDQTEIYASKKISFIIDELIQTESNYVSNLRKGLKNYGRLQERNDVPESLQGDERQRQLLGNIDEILTLHEEQVLPLLLRHQHDLKSLFDEFAAHFDKNNFYSYVIFTMNKKASMQLRQEQRPWLQTLQTEFNDKLGIDSFLVQPIQRLTRYPLLLQQFISEFYKSGISCKPVLMSVCKLETRMRRLLELVNQAEEIPNIDELGELNLAEQGHFRLSNEFDAYHYRTRKKYRAKVFLFDRCVVCAEVRKRRLAYRQHYAWPTLELQPNSSKSVTLLLRQPANGSTTPALAAAAAPFTSSTVTGGGGQAKEEYEFSAAEATAVTRWLRCARRLHEATRRDASLQGKFQLPMDLVLGVAIAIWLIWQYL